MGIIRLVNTDFWNDEKVIDNYSVEDKYFWLYLLTNPQTKQLGIYKLPKKIISFQTGYTLDAVNVLLERFQNKYKSIIYSSETQEVAILNYLKYSIIKGGKPVIDCIEKDIKQVANKSLLSSVYHNIKNTDDNRDTMQKIIQMLSVHEEERKEAKEIINDNDNDNDSIAPRNVNDTSNKRFIPPTVEQVKSYCLERKNNIDPEAFVDHYTTNGWMRGKTKIKDWKACVRTWEKSNSKTTSTKPNKFHNYEQRMTDYTPEQLEEIGRRNAENKLKRLRGE